jgi:hypothetical protein
VTKVFVATLVVLAPVFSAPLLLVAPNFLTNTVGNSPDSSDTSSGPESFHGQEIIGSGQFAGVPGNLLITQIAWRGVPGSGPVNLVFSSLTMSLSTTPYFPNTSGPLLTNTFATNLGPDNTLVYSGPLTLSSPGCAGPSACPFDLAITLSTPFLYNRNQGRLLWDIEATVQSSGDLDGQSFNFPPGGPIATLVAPSGELTGQVDASGDIVQFGYTLAPEPESFAMLVAGLAAVGALARRRSSSRGSELDPLRDRN